MREKESATSVIYVRHGKTDFPLDRIYCDDREDPPLNATGLAQADNTARLLHNQTVHAIYASPMARTQTTAKCIAREKSLPIQTDPRLKERHFGEWEGMYFDQIQSQYPETFQRWKQAPAAFQPDGGESMTDLLTRLHASTNEIIQKHDGETVVIVTHVGPIRVLVAKAMDMAMEAHRYLRIDYASLTRLDYGRSKTNLIYLNYQPKLP